MPSPAQDTRAFRNALGSFATGVTVITTRAGDGTAVGLTANSFNSVSLEPPMVLWSLAKTSRSMPVFAEAEHFAVHVLSADQEALSIRFAKSGEDKFAQLAVEEGIAGLPLLPGCAARFQCKTTFRHEGGDHIIFVGEVLDFDRSERPPLLYHAGQYALSARKGDLGKPRSARLAGSFNEDHLGYLLSRAHLQFYAPIRKAVHARGLSEDGYFLLSILTVRQALSREEALHLMSHSDHMDERLLDDLIAQGFIARANPADDRYHLTEHGRDTILHLMAEAKAREADVLSILGEVDAVALKTLLLRLVRGTVREGTELWEEPR